MIRVFIVDDHKIIREEIKIILQEEEDNEVVGDVENGEEALKQLKQIDCDIITLDMNMPGRCETDLLKDIRNLFPKTPVLVLSTLLEEKFT